MLDADDTLSIFSPCSLCNGPVGLIGILGNRAHGQCRDCGMAYSRTVDNNERREIAALTMEGQS